MDTARSVVPLEDFLRPAMARPVSLRKSFSDRYKSQLTAAAVLQEDYTFQM